MTFKRFLMIPQGTQTDLVNLMINRSLPSIAMKTAELSKSKWEAYRSYLTAPKEVKQEETENKTQENAKNPMKGIPNSWCELLKLNCKPCPKCKVRGVVMSAKHLKLTHNVDVHTPLEVWNQITGNREVNEKRDQIKKRVSPLIEANLSRMKNFLRL